MRPEATTRELTLALAATVVGGLFLFLALQARWNPQDMNPGIEGCLGAGVMGTVLALLSPMPYGRALFWTGPIVAIEYLAVAFSGGPAAGVVGLHLVIVGFIGLALGLRDRQPAPVEARPVEAAPQRG